MYLIFTIVGIATPILAIVLGMYWGQKVMRRQPHPKPSVLEILMLILMMTPGIAFVISFAMDEDAENFMVRLWLVVTVGMGIGAFLGWLQSHSRADSPSSRTTFGKMILGTLATVPFQVALLSWVACNFESSKHANETAAVNALMTFASAQTTFHKTDHYGKVYANTVDGKGFPDLYQIGGPGSNGELPKLIDIKTAKATSAESPRSGYYFVDLKYNDYSNQFGICAVPAKYRDSASGRYTFVIDTTWTVYRKDTRGQPVTEYPKDIAEWEKTE
jgi:hypothetical protein